MEARRPVTSAGVRVREYAGSDERAVLELVEADRLAGQPAVTPGMLAEALAGRSNVDAGWWLELDQPSTDVLVGPDDQVVGVVSYATRARDDAGLILWLHAREDPQWVGTLLDHVLSATGSRSRRDAFDFASALSLGLEGLPVRHRAVTHAELLARGFAGENLWRYMRRDVNVIDLPGLRNAVVTPCEDPEGWRLEVRTADGSLAAEATVGTPLGGAGVLWWIGVEPAHRGTGVARPLLDQAVALLAGQGAREVILFVDDDEPPGGERDRSAANHLYDSAGFVEVDRLYSYTTAS